MKEITIFKTVRKRCSICQSSFYLQNQANIPDEMRTFSDKIDTLLIARRQYDGNILYTNHLIQDYAMDFLDSSSNGKVSFKRLTNQIIFRSWQNDAKILHQGRGFRARFFMSGKHSCKAIFIANSSSCTTKELSKLLTSCLTAVKSRVIRYSETVLERSRENIFWSIKNSGEVLS